VGEPRKPSQTPTVVQQGDDAGTVGSADSQGGRAGHLREFAPGQIVAEKYLVERVIGEGGIGVVVAAQHLDLEQHVAIKYLRRQAVESSVVVQRFMREARLAAKIRSEHVVRVYDVGSLEGVPYMVMEYLEGTDLGQVLHDGGPLAVDLAVDYVLQACEALADAHSAGIVHRDLKPDNLFLARKSAGASVLKILDFGISKASDTVARSSGESKLTQDTDKFGTPHYMSPEQLRSAGDVDVRADVWAIGVVLYELLTGKVPFDGEGMPELLTAILHMPSTPLSEHVPGLPDGLQTIIECCLEKDRERRFRNVAELAQELRPFADASLHPRIDRIARIIRDGGSSVRPPSRDSLRGSDPSTGYRPSSTSSSSGSLSAAAPPARKRGPSALAVVAGLALVVGSALALFALRAGGPQPKAGALPPGAATLPPPVAVVAAPVQAAGLSATSLPPAAKDLPPAVASTTEPSATASTNAEAPPPPGSHSGPAPPPHQPVRASTRLPAPAAPSSPPAKRDLGGVVDPFR
jgi:serine/threonine-protein kinase